jgi:hypothetical protein
MGAAEEILYPVPSSQLDLVWDQVEDLLIPALNKTGGIKNYLPEDILKFLQAKDMQCWVLLKQTTVLAFIITEILTYPRRKVLNIFAGGAKKGLLSKDFKTGLKMHKTLWQFARKYNCEAIQTQGRAGWARVTRPSRQWALYEWEILNENIH